jgi:hypothetical protein
MLSATSTRWSLRIPLATVFIVIEDAGQLDHISKINSFARIRDLTKLSWAGK